MELYKPHVKELHDSEATVHFTRCINSLFDLLNGRSPKDGISPTSKIDKLKVTPTQLHLCRTIL